MSDAFRLNHIYRVEVKNVSKDLLSPCLFWSVPGDAALVPVAWKTAAAAPTTRLLWQFPYTPGFFMLPQALQQGQKIDESRAITRNVDFGFNNSIELSLYKKHYRFSTPHPNGTPGTLYLNESATVPDGEATVGIAIAGTPAVVTPSKSSTILSVPIALQLNLGFTTATAGTILDLRTVTSRTPINFPDNVTEMYVTCEDDGRVFATPHRPRLRILNTEAV